MMIGNFYLSKNISIPHLNVLVQLILNQRDKTFRIGFSSPNRSQNKCQEINVTSRILTFAHLLFLKHLVRRNRIQIFIILQGLLSLMERAIYFKPLRSVLTVKSDCTKKGACFENSHFQEAV